MYETRFTDNFEKLKRVLLSCRTREQLDLTYDWILKVRGELHLTLCPYAQDKISKNAYIKILYNEMKLLIKLMQQKSEKSVETNGN